MFNSYDDYLYWSDYQQIEDDRLNAKCDRADEIHEEKKLKEKEEQK